MYEIKHEWNLANVTPQLHDEEFYASWLHGAWKSPDCLEKSLQHPYLCKLLSVSHCWLHELRMHISNLSTIRRGMWAELKAREIAAELQ